MGVVVPVIVLSIIGVLMVRSARPDLMGRQMLGVLLGIGAMIVISLIDYKWVLNFYWPMYFLNLILLAAIWIPGLGVESKRRKAVAEPGDYPAAALRPDKDPYDPVFCKISVRPGKIDQ